MRDYFFRRLKKAVKKIIKKDAREFNIYMETIKLSKLKSGQEGRIAKVNAEGYLRRRLYDMGATAGAKVKYIKKAPLGDPIEINLRGYSLSLRRTEADFIEVMLDEENKAEGLNAQTDNITEKINVGSEKLYKNDNGKPSLNKKDKNERKRTR